jgi:hypothetical protein
MRLRNDSNNDGIITRAEWRGSARDAVHGWNADGSLSDEFGPRPAQWGDRSIGFDTERVAVGDWTKHSRISITIATAAFNSESGTTTWSRSAASIRTTTDLSREEFLSTAQETTPGRQFRLSRSRTATVRSTDRVALSLEAFNWTDRNRDGVISETRRLAGGGRGSGLPASTSTDGRIEANEWHWSRRFVRDLNRDGC